MNLPYTHKLLMAAHRQPHGSLELHGFQADFEVRQMEEAGLVEASFADGKDGSFTAIKRVTAAGETFLRAFRDHPIPVVPTHRQAA